MYYRDSTAAGKTTTTPYVLQTRRQWDLWAIKPMVRGQGYKANNIFVFRTLISLQNCYSNVRIIHCCPSERNEHDKMEV